MHDNFFITFEWRAVECVPPLNAALDYAGHNEPKIRTEPFSNENGGILILDLLKRFYQFPNLHPRHGLPHQIMVARKQTNGSFMARRLQTRVGKAMQFVPI